MRKLAATALLALGVAGLVYWMWPELERYMKMRSM